MKRFLATSTRKGKLRRVIGAKKSLKMDVGKDIKIKKGHDTDSRGGGG